MKKKLIALFCLLSLLLTTVPAAALEGEALRSADLLATLNLVDGKENGDYALDTPATRAQAAVLLVRLAGAESAAKKDGQRTAFRDLPVWARDEIVYAARQGWAYGASASAFNPNEPISANAWFGMLLRMLGYSEKANDFRPEDAPAFAQRIGLVSGSYSGNLTRGDLFASMAEALQFSYKGQDLTVLENLIQTGTCSRYTANALGLLNRELTARQLADRHMSAVFCMDLYNNEAAVSDKTPTSNASGFFISADGLAVTNYHSIEGSLYATATLCTGDVYEIDRVIYYDKEIDIAVIRVSQTSVTNQTTSAFAYLDLVGTDDIRHGDIVYTLGNPLGLGLAVSSGIISDIARDVDRYQLPCVMSTASISQGSSGGALLNVYGQVIAVTSGAYTYGNNMYLAVPVDPVLTADLSANGQTLAAVAVIEAANAA